MLQYDFEDILGDTTRRLPVVIGIVQLAGLISGTVSVDRLGRCVARRVMADECQYICMPSTG